MKRRKSGDKEFFLEIWNERVHESEISGEMLHEPRTFHFAHILAKGGYPSFRHRKDNIVLMTFEEHQLFDHSTHKAKADKRFDWVFKKQEELREEYYNEQL